MKPIDFAKAVGVALVIMFVNVLISVLVITVYSYAIAPGHDEAFYQTAAQRIAPWSSVVFGAPLFFGAAYWLARRRPERSAVAFAIASFGAYAVIDLAVVVASGALVSMIIAVSLSMISKLLGAYFGARLAVRA